MDHGTHFLLIIVRIQFTKYTVFSNLFLESGNIFKTFFGVVVRFRDLFIKKSYIYLCPSWCTWKEPIHILESLIKKLKNYTVFDRHPFVKNLFQHNMWTISIRAFILIWIFITPFTPLPPPPPGKETLAEDGWCSPDLGSVFCLSPRQNKYILSPPHSSYSTRRQGSSFSQPRGGGLQVFNFSGGGGGCHRRFCCTVRGGADSHTVHKLDLLLHPIWHV